MSNDLTWPRRTKQLELHPPNLTVIDEVLAVRNDPEMNRWFMVTSAEPEPFRKAWLESVDDPDAYHLVAMSGGAVVGIASLEISDGMGQGMGGTDTESLPWRHSEGSIDYMIKPAYAGQGYATEIVRDLLSLAFDDLGLRRVTGGCFADNIASWRVMEKAGMRREQHGVQDSWHEELGWIDGYMYGILAEEWKAS
ncbi:MAG TPA: GNAT family protein [Nocardioidaceae bacterium]|jgi:RimJ/RimL family protein N-acetyltransferase